MKRIKCVWRHKLTENNKKNNPLLKFLVLTKFLQRKFVLMAVKCGELGLDGLQFTDKILQKKLSDFFETTCWMVDIRIFFEFGLWALLRHIV